jgi:hypothetical protein
MSASTAAGAAESPVAFNVSQRLWAASWDVTALDTQIVSLEGRPAIELDRANASVSRVIPITSVGVRWADVNLFGSVSPSTSFSASGLGGDRVSRREWELGVGYEFMPAWSVSLIYKSGTVSEAATARARDLIPAFSGPVKLSGWLVGVSGATPLPSNGMIGTGWSAYGNLALGAGKGRPSSSLIEPFNLRYQIAEVGLRYAFNDGGPVGVFGGVSANVGYRAQIITQRVQRQWLDPVDMSLLAEERRRVSAATHGFVFGLAVAF